MWYGVFSRVITVCLKLSYIALHCSVQVTVQQTEVLLSENSFRSKNLPLFVFSHSHRIFGHSLATRPVLANHSSACLMCNLKTILFTDDFSIVNVQETSWCTHLPTIFILNLAKERHVAEWGGAAKDRGSATLPRTCAWSSRPHTMTKRAHASFRDLLHSATSNGCHNLSRLIIP
jgi:hypothetical protein